MKTWNPRNYTLKQSKIDLSSSGVYWKEQKLVVCCIREIEIDFRCLYFVDKWSQLRYGQSSVEFEEAPNVADEKLLLDFVHEHFELLVVRLH